MSPKPKANFFRWLPFPRGEAPAAAAGSMAAVLYTRQGCHLCEDARAVLERHGFTVEEQDIDAQPELCERYNLCVPVVVIDGKERFRGKVDERLLKRLISARQ